MILLLGELNVSFVYGSNDAAARERLWDELRQLATIVTNWIVLGDFNIVRAMEERIGPHPPSLTEIMAFNQCLLDSNLDDAQGFGCEHTWTNKQDVDTRVWSKLDRLLTNASWLVEFPHTQVTVLHPGISDHSPLLVQIKENYQIRRRHQFIALHKANYSGLAAKVKQAKQILETCQKQVQLNPLDINLLTREKKLLEKYWTLRKTERSSLIQRAKIQDINYNDASTSYFYVKIATRKHQSIIGKIRDKDGILREGMKDVNNAFVDYYQWLLGTTTTTADFPPEVLEGPRIQENDWDSLCRPVEDMDIKRALFSIASNKSPG
ncbi:uncharacterized protein LOC141649310 [Silene latifolia]|uniref:uncharacterized protein LOC141649310 n=1 Tax=Silene latifolia TaxID=37657 RepID=UPI003D77255E